MERERYDEAAKIGKDLAEGFSAQAKFSNRVWLALIASATLALFPETDFIGKVKLPFALGSVDTGTYKVIGFFILTILMISYCQTYAAAHVAVRIAHKTIDGMEPDAKRLTRQLFDMHVTPTLARVAPLAQLLNSQRIAACYYCLLKTVAIAVILGIPTTALFVVFLQVSENTTVPFSILLLALFALCITAIAIVQLVCTEVKHMSKVTRMYWTGQLRNIE